ncbi:MAG TPA: DUF441 domain-containing protein [Patescibacteria group bacterium]|nr:DUF441 domain-containing protein [Patescibacteria group bacterium]
MHWESVPLLIILVISVLASNSSVAIAALVLLLMKLLNMDQYFPWLESNGIPIGITVLTLAVLTPIAQGKLSLADMAGTFKSVPGLVAIIVGIFVSWLAHQGVVFMKDSPEAVTALIVGTIIGVCFFQGLAVGPLIAGGLVSLLVSWLGKISH